MALATTDADGAPDVRMVLLKDFDARGFTFHTNFDSAKGRQLATRPHAALCFYWKSLRRQVRLRGRVERVEDAASDAYFKTRDRGARLGAWASLQSQELPDRLALEKRIGEYAARFGLGEVPRPENWGGFRIVPLSIEFWRNRLFRLHDRLVFTRDAAGETWAKKRLYP